MHTRSADQAICLSGTPLIKPTYPERNTAYRFLFFFFYAILRTTKSVPS